MARDDRNFRVPYQRSSGTAGIRSLQEADDLSYEMIRNTSGIPDDGSETWSIVYFQTGGKEYSLAMTRKLYHAESEISIEIDHAFVGKPKVMVFLNDEKPADDTIEYEVSHGENYVSIEFSEAFTGDILLV